ncbi:hypothetical protein DKY63_30070 [Pseudomonas putida]|uniref:Uncharacterized protein n=1 Tax=Pseudomonas putida TaxID=303 RepID=A0A2Z4RSC0_PSEPU|nr:hypothetical protein DKY63_30070 [Pseudomonas putida]
MAECQTTSMLKICRHREQARSYRVRGRSVRALVVPRFATNMNAAIVTDFTGAMHTVVVTGAMHAFVITCTVNPVIIPRFGMGAAAAGA